MSGKRRQVLDSQHPQIPTLPIPPRFRRALLPLALVLCLLGTAYAWFSTEQATESTRRYDQASLCRSATDSGCRRELAATVVQLQRIRGQKGGVSVWATLQLPDGNHQFQIGEGDLYDTLHEGMQLQATEWEGQVVELHDGVGHHLLIAGSPLDQERQGSFLRIGGILFLYVLSVLMIKRIWLDKTPTPPALSTLPPLPTFPTPAQTRSLMADAEEARSVLEASRARTGAKTQSLKQPGDRHSI